MVLQFAKLIKQNVNKTESSNGFSVNENLIKKKRRDCNKKYEAKKKITNEIKI